MPRLFKISPTLCLSVCLTIPCLAVTDNGTPVETRLRQIQTSLQQGNWEEARRQLGDAISHFPRQSSLYNFMGVVEGQTGNYRAAETNFRRALEISPRFTGAAINLGKLYQENSQQDAGALAKAFQVYRRVLAYEPANAEARYQSTIVCLRQGQYRTALAELAHLPADVQGRPQSLAARCAGLAGLDKDDEAGRMAGTLLVHPELELRQKSFAAAGKALRRAVELDADNFGGNMHLLRLYLATNDPRAEAQQRRFDEVTKKRSEKEASLLRTIVVKPY